MRDFLTYFFGQGTEVEFTNFSLAHFLPILLMLGVILLIFRCRKSLAKSKWDHHIRHLMAFLLILSELSYFWRLVAVTSLNPNPVDHLPITVCGWVVVFASLMVLGKSQTLFDLCYFWLLSGSVFALITPTVISYTGPTRFRYYQFWVEHTMGYVAVFYMIFVHHMRPTVKSAVKAYIGLVILALIAYFVNDMLPGANYLFMAKPEAAPSVLDILPPNFVLRLLVMVAAVTVLFVLAYVPWYLKDKKEAKNKVAV